MPIRAAIASSTLDTHLTYPQCRLALQRFHDGLTPHAAQYVCRFAEPTFVIRQRRTVYQALAPSLRGSVIAGPETCRLQVRFAPGIALITTQRIIVICGIVVLGFLGLVWALPNRDWVFVVGLLVVIGCGLGAVAWVLRADDVMNRQAYQTIIRDMQHWLDSCAGGAIG